MLAAEARHQLQQYARVIELPPSPSAAQTLESLPRPDPVEKVDAAVGSEENIIRDMDGGFGRSPRRKGAIELVQLVMDEVRLDVSSSLLLRAKHYTQPFTRPIRLLG